MQLGRAALAYQVPLGDQWGCNWAVHIRMWSLARLLADQASAGKGNRSTLVTLASEIAFLAGGVKTQRARLGVLIENMGLVRDATNAAEQVARDVLGHEPYSDAEKRGSRLFCERSGLERLALGTSSINAFPGDSLANKGAPSSWRNLSKTEQEVATLAAAGWSNSAIAVRRGTSTRTTDAQISSIFEKLMITSRRDIIRFVPEDEHERVLAESSHIPQ